MRVSQQLTKTLREAEGGNQELLVRAGFIRQLMAGVYSFLPIGERVLRKLTQIVREEMDRAGGQEVRMPALQPKELWEKRPTSGPSRAEIYAPVLFTLNDRRGRDIVLGPTHEEVVTLLVSEFIRSYRDLPQRIYQIQTKFRNEPRPRGGLLRSREFPMMDLYSFDTDEGGLDRSYEAMAEAYVAIFRRIALRFIAIHADSGGMGGRDSQEFIALTDAGEDEALVCASCDYAANVEKAEFVRSQLPSEPEAALQEVYTPNCMSIRDLATFLAVPENKTIKVVCYVVGGRMVLALVRGDLDINEVKLANALYSAGLNATDLHLATPEELQQTGIVAGFTSPLNKGPEKLIVADLSLQQGTNFVAGANRVDYHLKNVNYPRDFRVDTWADLASAYAGATCACCGDTLHLVRGSEAGHIFKLGTKYSDLLGGTYLDAQGNERPIQMGSYGIGISRLMGIIVEQHHDEKGILWPFSIAPYSVALLGLDLDKAESRQAAEQLYADLTSAGVEVLYDDRLETAGVKFNDADLIGLPLRAVVSRRSLKNGGIELKLRSQKESRIVPLTEAVTVIREEMRKGITEGR